MSWVSWEEGAALIWDQSLEAHNTLPLHSLEPLRIFTLKAGSSHLEFWQLGTVWTLKLMDYQRRIPCLFSYKLFKIFWGKGSGRKIKKNNSSPGSHPHCTTSILCASRRMPSSFQNLLPTISYLTSQTSQPSTLYQ